MRLEQLQPADMPVTVDAGTLQSALAVLMVSTSTSGKWDSATAAGLSSIAASVDAGSVVLPRITTSDNGKEVTITPAAWVEDFKGAVRLARSLFPRRLPSAGRGSNAEVLLWLAPARALVPMLNDGMTRAQQNRVLTRAHVDSYRAMMDAIDQASFAYGAALEQDGPFREKVMELTGQTDGTGTLTTRFQNVVHAWTHPMPRWNGEILPAGSLHSPLLAGGIIAGVIVVAGVVGVGLWQAPAIGRAAAEYQRARNVGNLLERLPKSITPDEAKRMLDGARAAHGANQNPDTPVSPWVVGGVLLGATGAALALSPKLRASIAGLFSRRS